MATLCNGCHIGIQIHSQRDPIVHAKVKINFFFTNEVPNESLKDVDYISTVVSFTFFSYSFITYSTCYFSMKIFLSFLQLFWKIRRVFNVLDGFAYGIARLTIELFSFSEKNLYYLVKIDVFLMFKSFFKQYNRREFFLCFAFFSPYSFTCILSNFRGLQPVDWSSLAKNDKSYKNAYCKKDQPSRKQINLEYILTLTKKDS